MKRLFMLLLLGSGVVGCSSDNLPEYNRLGDLRVLAIQADQPEVSPGTTVNLTPLVSDIGGAGRALSWIAEGCTDPGVGYGAQPSCDSASDRVQLGIGNWSPGAPAFTEAGTVFQATVPSDILDRYSTGERHNGVAYLITYQVSAADGSTVRSFKRVIASDRAVRNSNPQIGDILKGDASLTALPGEEAALSVSMNAGATETYTVLDSDSMESQKTETLLTSWFISDGEFKRYRVLGEGENVFTPPASPPTNHAVVIVAVVRDGRGGEDFEIRAY